MENNNNRPIVYKRGNKSETAAFDMAAPVAAALTSAAIYIIAVFAIVSGKTLLSKITGIALIVVYTLYIARYMYNFFCSRKLITDSSTLTDTYIETSNAKWTKRFLLTDVAMTFSYSSSSNMTIIVATETDYMTITTSCGYLLSRDKNGILPPFYKLNQAFMDMNPKHINYVRNKKYKKKMPFRVPTFIFESEYDTAGVTRFIDSLRKNYSTKLNISGES